MLDRVKKAVFETFNAEEKKGVFLSAFKKDQSLSVSQGVLTTDMPLRELLETVYNTTIEPILKDIEYIVCDVVMDLIEIKDTKELLGLSPQEFGFAIIDLDDENTGVILPNTQGVVDTKSVIYDIKQKYGIHGRAETYVFRTQRIIIAK